MAPGTQPTDVDVTTYLEGVTDPRRREDALALRDLMAAATGSPAVMWGPSIVGFGSLPSTSGQDWFVVGFSPRKAALVIYGVLDETGEPLTDLGAHTVGKGCINVKRLDAVDGDALTALVRQAWERAGS